MKVEELIRFLQQLPTEMCVSIGDGRLLLIGKEIKEVGFLPEDLKVLVLSTQGDDNG